MPDQAAVVVCDSEQDRKSFRAALIQTFGLKAGDVISVKKVANQRDLWEWEHVLSGPIDPHGSAEVAVAVRVRSKAELDRVFRLAGAREIKAGITPMPWPSDVFEADPKYVSDQLP